MKRMEFMKILGGAVFAAKIAKPEERKHVERMNLDKAKAFAQSAFFEIPTNHLEGNQIITIDTCCVDGRRPSGETGLPPECAIPGADEGVIANILAAANKLNLSLEVKRRILDKYISLKGGLGNFHYHTDEDAEKKESKVGIAAGCGHFRISTEDPKAYGLVTEDISIILGILKSATEKKCKREIMAGDHKEAAVMLIDDETLALKHTTHEGQAFIYNRALHKKLLAVLAENLATELGPNITAKQLESELLATNDLQLLATVTRLAKGLKMYSVTKGENGKIEVKESGEVK